jgi:hypothetical protein
LLFPTLVLLGWVAYQIIQRDNNHNNNNNTALGATWKDLASPLIIGSGLILMYQTSVGSWSSSSITTTTKTTINTGWYWVGESMVIFMFLYNSLAPPPSSSSSNNTRMVVGGVAGGSMLAALWFRGKFWNYIIVLALEVFVALFIAMSFPIFEMILEAILNDKLKKVGDKVRAQHAYMERYYNNNPTKRKEKE